MFLQSWFIPFLLSFPLSTAITYAGKKAGNVFWERAGMLLIIVNLAFLVLTIFVADKWWYGVVTFLASYLIQIIYRLIRPLLMLTIPNIWSLIEIVSGITLPILSFIYLFS